MPKVAIACYSNTTFERILGELDADYIAKTSTANGLKPVYKAKYKNVEIALFMIDVGAPMSAGPLLSAY